MKTIYILIASILIPSTYSYADHVGSAGWGAFTCAPEVVSGNVMATERVLTDVLASSDFENAQKLKDIVENMKNDSDELKMIKYFSFVGVDAGNKKAVIEFIGARKLAPYTSVLTKNFDLSNLQADILVKRINKSLKGE